jgi:uncharacterized protein YutD
MQFKSKHAHDAYQKLMTTTLSKNAIEALRIAQDFARVTEAYMEYNGESEATLSRGLDLALSSVLTRYDAYGSDFTFAMVYLERFWKYHFKVADMEELLSNVSDGNFLLINI